MWRDSVRQDRAHATTVHRMRPAQRFDAHAMRRPEWLIDLLSVRPGPLSASTWAWTNRWLSLPIRFEHALSLGEQFELSDGELLHLTHAAARRIHFALETLRVFTQEALRRFPDDALLRVLLHAAALCEHLSERVLNERHLVVEILSINSAPSSEDPRGRPDIGL